MLCFVQLSHAPYLSNYPILSNFYAFLLSYELGYWCWKWTCHKSRGKTNFFRLSWDKSKWKMKQFKLGFVIIHFTRHFVLGLPIIDKDYIGFQMILYIIYIEFGEILINILHFLSIVYFFGLFYDWGLLLCTGISISS